MSTEHDSGLVGPDGQPIKTSEEIQKDYDQVSNEQDQSEQMEVNFMSYITSLGYQAMIFMGDIPNPITNKTEKNLKQAKFLIDTMALIEEKTQGNLEKQEEDLLKGSLYELRMKYVGHVNRKEEAS